MLQRTVLSSLILKTNRRSVHYRSQDGGLSWELEYYSPNIEWGGMEVETPRGKFVIQGYDVLVLTVDGEWTVIYSATDFQVEANIWVQEQTTPGVGIEGFFPKPYSITYDVRSGNVVVATCLQGVVVGTPEGQWSAVAVGDHSSDRLFICRQGPCVAVKWAPLGYRISPFGIDDCDIPCLCTVSDRRRRVGNQCHGGYLRLVNRSSLPIRIVGID